MSPRSGSAAAARRGRLQVCAFACGAMMWLAGCSTAPAPVDDMPNANNPTEDPHLWLEDVDGERAMRWVRARNRATLGTFAQRPGVKDLRAKLREVFDAPDRIPGISKIGAHYYNLWRDLENPRGLWRRATLAEYRKATPAWEPVLDLDALAKEEGENWVAKGFNCRQPDYRRCLVSLSRGGADAVVTREFDLAGKTFVDAADGGFELPEAKSSVAWAGPDTVFVATDFGPGSLTDSGYPRIVKLWRREQPLAQAEVVFEGEASDVSVSAAADLAPGFEVQFVRRGTDFFHSEVFVRRPESGELVPLPKPADAAFSALRGRLFLELKSDWTTAQGTFAAGSLLSAQLEDLLAHPPGEATLEVLFEPEAGVFLTDYAPTRGHVILNVLDHVRSRVYVATPPRGERSGAAWTRRPLLPRTANGTEFRTVRVQAVDPDEDDRYFMYTNDYLTPSTLSLGTAAQAGAPPEILKQATARFDAEGLTMAQHWAVSADGTRIPYFQVGPRDAGLEGGHPTLLHGYGGFQISMLPAYSAGIGIGWLSRGGVYVVANIRGGGEFGPAWHRAALRENRGRAYEDLIAVAQDLVRRRVTEPSRLGVLGGSNGGLLTGNMLVRRPALFGAVVSMVPLFDMRRYHVLLAGASWIAEFGNPDDPDDWRFLRNHSPYHNIHPDQSYPPVLITTSTRDDRVHPGHARKMVAKLRALGHDVTYYENTEGGHGGAANNAQSAFMWALVYEFLWRELGR